MSFSKRCQVALIHEGDFVYYHAIEALLKRDPQLEVFDLDVRKGNTVQRIKDLAPQVVLFVCESDYTSLRPSLWEIFSEVPSARVLLVCLSDSKLRIYSCQEESLAGGRQLIHALRPATKRAKVPVPA